MPTGDRLFYVARTIPTYRIGVLRQLNRRLEDRLVVCHGMPPHSSSLRHIQADLGQDVPVVPLTNRWVAGEKLHYQNVFSIFRTAIRPAAILAEESPRSVSLPVLIATAKAMGIPIGLWGHFSSNSRSFSVTNPADFYRLTLARWADACVCYTNGIAELLRPHLSDRKLFVAQNTLDTDALFTWHSALSQEGKRAVRERIGLPPTLPLLAFIGRLIKAKGTDTLLRIVRHLQDKREVGLVIVGDGPERSEMERTAAKLDLQHVCFTGALPTFEESSAYLFAADVMLLPGYVGLAVNHGFALGLPVVTHGSPGKMRYHSPEIEYVIDGYNGRIVEHGDISAFVRGVQEVLESQPQYSKRAQEYARIQLSAARMVDGLESAYRFLEGS